MEWIHVKKKWSQKIIGNEDIRLFKLESNPIYTQVYIQSIVYICENEEALHNCRM